MNAVDATAPRPEEVASAAAQLAGPELRDHLVEGFADTVAAWLRGLIEPAQACQPWCVWPGRSCGGECLSEGTVVAATAGVRVLAECGMRVPRMEANTIITESGAAAVNLSIHGPINEDDDRAAWAYLSPAEARAIAHALLVEADRAEGVTS
jgi:hypothetical protein